MHTVKFISNERFFEKTLNRRVDAYFKKHSLNKGANATMIIKTITLLSLYILSYALIISGMAQQAWIYYTLCAIMGIGMAGIGMSVMHDANHGAYSKKKWVNTLLGYSLGLMGAHVFNWKIQHNVLHHSFTNIEGVDEDITPRGILRFSPHTPWMPVHRYQYIYAWLLYGFLSIIWICFKDFERLIKYSRNGLVSQQKTSPLKEWAILIATKVIYITYILVIPILMFPSLWGQIILGFFLMHYVGGVILANIFQVSHVSEEVEYPTLDKHGNINESWAIHQLRTAIGFCYDNKLLSWYVGGLNFQIEHHLFPNICHVHYKKLAPIVAQTAKEFNLPYRMKKTYAEALIGHYNFLKILGKKQLALHS